MKMLKVKALVITCRLAGGVRWRGEEGDASLVK
jgi:hypothetical protein